MREMKDSGMTWLGQVPSDWRYIRLKTFYSFEKGKNAQRYTVDYIGQHDGQYPVYSGQTENDGIMGTIDSFDYDIPECLFSTTVGAKVMTPKILSGKFSLSQNCLIMKQVKECDNHYMFYYLHPLFDYEKGSIPSYMQPSLRVDDLKKYGFFIPGILEQKQISAFLDSKCAEIDALSTIIQSEIDTLEAYKRSVITEAVTKGLDKTVPMKDSGIEWVGQIPEHWGVDKVKYHLRRYEPRNPGNQEVLSVYREYGVIPKDSRDDNYNVTSEDTSKYKYVKPGNLVINKMKAWQGSMGVSEYEGIVSPAYFIYHFEDDLVVPKYLHYLFRSCYKDEFRRISGGIREGQWDLSPEAFNNTLFLIPPIDEQYSIISYADSKAKEIESLINTKNEQLEVLTDYKKSLIYEYVTGKKEVPVA